MAEARRSYLRLTLEVLAIVFSILVAFAVDAAWEARQERRAETLILRSVLDEAKENQARLAEKRRWQEDVGSVTDNLLSAASNSTRTVPGDSIDHLLGQATFWSGSIAWETAAVDAVVSSGGLAELSDPTLRLALTGWRSRLALLEGIERQEYDLFTDRWMPYLLEHTNLPRIHNATTHLPGSTEPWDLDAVPELGAADYALILQSQQFRNLVLYKKWVHLDLLDTYEAIEPVLERLVQSLTDALEEAAP